MAPVLKANGRLYRYTRAPRSGPVRAHLGPGQDHYLAGWINVDANVLSAKADVWADLRNPLPFHDGTVDAFDSHHVIEHLPDAMLPAHFREMYRCLKPGGVIRVGGPNGDNACRKFVEGDAAWFADFPDAHPSLGGKLVNFIFCRGEHLTLLTLSYLTEIATAAGFADVAACVPKTQTNYPRLFDEAVIGNEWEPTPEVPHTLLVEARKPPAP